MLGSFIHREQYSLDLIPFDGDLLSMESESAFKVSAPLNFEERRRVFLCWLLGFGTGACLLSEGFSVTRRAGKDLAEHTWLDPESQTEPELLCVFSD